MAGPGPRVEGSGSSRNRARGRRSGQAEAAGLGKERVRHVRMGNKSNVAAIDARLATLDPQRQVPLARTPRRLVVKLVKKVKLVKLVIMIECWLWLKQTRKCASQTGPDGAWPVQATQATRATRARLPDWAPDATHVTGLAGHATRDSEGT